MSEYLIDHKSRFSEEILETSDQNPLGIYVDKECVNQRDEVYFFLKNSPVCWYCYYDEFFEMLNDKVRKSKRDDFVRHQALLRQFPSLFLTELENLLIDYEEYLNEQDSNTLSHFIQIISSMKEDFKSDIPTKARLVLNFLYEQRETSGNYDLDEILFELGILNSDNDFIGSYLQDNDFAKVAFHSDGAAIQISTNGIMEMENDSPSINDPENISHEELLDELILHIDHKFADLKVEVNLNASELASMIEKLVDDFNSYSKPSIRRLVRMRLSEYVVSESVKEVAVVPALNQLVEQLFLD